VICLFMVRATGMCGCCWHVCGGVAINYAESNTREDCAAQPVNYAESNKQYERGLCCSASLLAVMGHARGAQQTLNPGFDPFDSAAYCCSGVMSPK
jgi:hypothetical protein